MEQNQQSEMNDMDIQTILAGGKYFPMRIYTKEQVSIAVDVYKQSLQYFNEMQHVWDDAKRMELLEQYVSLRNENIVFAAMAQAMAEVLGITSEQ
jgi:hypothetical protein